MRDHCRRESHEAAAIGGTEAYLRLSQIAAPCAGGDSVDRDASEAAIGEPSFDDASLFDRVLHGALQMIREEFHERTWLAFWGVTVEGRPTADVAADLSMQPGAVRVAKSRVLQRLRRELGDQT
jgi:RNA polymerase sigma-70 factor (ECF subfamily)